MEITELIGQHCLEELNLQNFKMDDEFYYQSLPLCVIDSIFSIGVKYESVKNAVNNFCKHKNIKPHRENKNEIPNTKDQYSVEQFIADFSSVTPEELAENIFKNRQRTSTRSGILKAEAIQCFIQVLNKYNINHFQDMHKFSKSAEMEIKSIPGQSSGISTQYFLMLAGNDELIKPDRMVIRFIESCISQKVNIEDAQELISSACEYINKNSEVNISARELDNAIWNYQRSKN